MSIARSRQTKVEKRSETRTPRVCTTKTTDRHKRKDLFGKGRIYSGMQTRLMLQRGKNRFSTSSRRSVRWKIKILSDLAMLTLLWCVQSWCHRASNVTGSTDRSSGVRVERLNFCIQYCFIACKKESMPWSDRALYLRSVARGA